MTLKRICFLLNNDFTADNRVRREAESLTRAGYQVTLICIASEKPNTPRKEIKKGVEIHRLLKKRLYKYHAFSFRLLKTVLSILRIYRKFDLVHAHDANMLPLGWILSRFWGAKLIYDSHEYWGALFEEERAKLNLQQGREKPSVIRKKLKQLKGIEDFEIWALSRCDAVISVNDSICRFLQEKAEGKLRYCIVLRNLSERTQVQKKPLLHEEFDIPATTKVLLYQGQVSPKRGIGSLVEAMAFLEGFALVIVGPVLPGDVVFQQSLQEKITQSPKLQNAVFFKETIPPHILLQWTASADLGIHPILNTSLNHYYCLPNKIFEYLQAEIPVAASNFPEMHQIIETHQVGFTFNPENPSEIATQIKRFFQDATLQGKIQHNIHRAKEDLCWENEEQQLLGLYEAILIA